MKETTVEAKSNFFYSVAKGDQLKVVVKRDQLNVFTNVDQLNILSKKEELIAYDERDQIIAFAKSQIFGKLSLTLMRSQANAQCQNNDFVSLNVDGIM